ncbi:hypothetical protein HFP51_00515 [Parasphingopyxis sp. CP4]|uniref:hypothetical protein n=1 Tax=Parasphingopyxis sp. CP4 TaxID=2724527 RepID=UPI0015A36150|nr:hypothetical protein [Parasphingopyxis sp. CP4]QLC20798.1 hypothetical protein HFP51_00515 [Parasphingopyxis sp. CP4]
MKRRSGPYLATLAILGLAGNGVAAPADQSDVMWLSICGRPDMRIAIEIDRDQEPANPRDCAQACHSAMGRKAFSGTEHGTSDGAMV